MPTSAHSNYPHVRITHETHEKVRLLCFYLRMSQGELVDMMANEQLAALGNPSVHVPKRGGPGARKVAGSKVTEPARAVQVEEPTKPTRRKRGA